MGTVAPKERRKIERRVRNNRKIEKAVRLGTL
jgi:hypothetical protein